MAHIIGLTETTYGNQIMVNADHITYWETTPTLGHTFQPYADNPDLCVAEIPNGDTCNQEQAQHAVTTVHLSDGTILAVSESIYVINERIDVIQAALETWIDD